MGDVGYLDEEGFLYLTDRKNFTIITGGVNVYPAEIEGLLISHDKVADVAVFGIPHPEFGEEVMAVVQLHHRHDLLPKFGVRDAKHCDIRHLVMGN